MSDWIKRFDELMGQRERLFEQRGSVIITDSKQITYDAIKAFIHSVREEAYIEGAKQERQKVGKAIKWLLANGAGASFYDFADDLLALLEKKEGK